MIAAAYNSRMLKTLAALACVTAALALAGPASSGRALPAEMPAHLTDQEFWKLSADSSEPGGYFRSQDITNLTSNEMGDRWCCRSCLPV